MATNKGVISIPWGANMINRASKKAKSLGSIKNSILKGGGNLAGYLGEEAVAAYINAEIISCNDGDDKYNYDIWKNSRRIEVKTKRRTVQPLDYFDVSILKQIKFITSMKKIDNNSEELLKKQVSMDQIQ